MPKDPISPTLTKTLLAAVKNGMLQLNVSLPARVEAYDVDEQRASVLPLLKRSLTTGETFTLPTITNVPVQWPSANSGTAFLHLPLKEGDLGLVLFTDRSIDEYLSGSGQPVLPEEKRFHSLSDAVFVPGVLPFSQAISTADSDNVILRNGNMKVILQPEGRISIEGAGQEFLTIVDSFIQNVISLNISIASGSSAGVWPISPATLASLQLTRTKLATLLGTT